VSFFKDLLLNVSLVILPTSVSVDAGNVSVPVFVMVDIIGAVNVLFVNVSVVARPTKVSVDVGSVSVPVLEIVAMTGVVNVLFVNVCVAVKPTNVSVTSGNVKVLLAVCDDNIVVAVAVVPAASNLICFVLSVLSAIIVEASISVLFVNVSVVALPTSVSVDVGNVNVPVLLMDDIIGVVNVLFVNVCAFVVPTMVISLSGMVIVLVVAVVMLDIANCIFFVLSVLSTNDVELPTNDLFVTVSVVALPKRVSVDVGNVKVPVLLILEIIGVVNVLLVNVWVVSVPTRVVVASGRETTRFVV